MKESTYNQSNHELSVIQKPELFKSYSYEDKERIVNYIFGRIESGLSYFDAVKDPFAPDKDLISTGTFQNWLNDNLSWSKEYSRVCQVRYDILAEQTIKIADSERVATKTVESEKGIFTTTYDNTERSRLQINARQWLVGKLASQKYGANAGEASTVHEEQPLFNDIG